MQSNIQQTRDVDASKLRIHDAAYAEGAYSDVSGSILLCNIVHRLQKGSRNALALKGWQHQDLTQPIPLPVRVCIEGVQSAEANLNKNCPVIGSTSVV